MLTADQFRGLRESCAQQDGVFTSGILTANQITRIWPEFLRDFWPGPILGSNATYEKIWAKLKMGPIAGFLCSGFPTFFSPEKCPANEVSGFLPCSAYGIAYHADTLRAASRVPPPRPSAEMARNLRRPITPDFQILEVHLRPGEICKKMGFVCWAFKIVDLNSFQRETGAY